MNELLLFITSHPSFHMWFVLILILGAVVSYASEKVSLELTSIIILSLLLVFFYAYPLLDESGKNILSTEKILLGFANPALIAVISLLILGQAVVQTGALNEVAHFILYLGRNNAIFSITITLIVVVIISALLNNTPVVVIFIPIMAALARGVDYSVSKVMIPLSFASILGGMTTLIGSSTNLLVSGILVDIGLEPLGFFDFTIPALALVGVGFVYILVIAPRLLPDRASMVHSVVGGFDDASRKFVSQIEVDYDSKFVGHELKDGGFKEFPDMTIRMIQRGEHAFLPPFEEDMKINVRDIIIVSGGRKDLAKLYAKSTDELLKESDEEEDRDDAGGDISMAEVIIAPASRMIGNNLEQIGFYREHNCVVLGIQRQSRIIRARVTEIRLAAGDVLLVLGRQEDILALHESKDLLLMEWSTEELQWGRPAKLTGAIFFGVVAASAFNILPITISAFAGVAAILITKCINLRQAARAMDMKIVLVIATSLALGAGLQETGGASFIAYEFIDLMNGASVTVMLSALFIFMAIITNVLSNNASAVLFTPIAVNMANQLGVDPKMFIFAVIFACNCSFATPIGYQTNLLVMGPGHNKFSDFMRSGIPLVIIIWMTYTFFAPWYFNAV